MTYTSEYPIITVTVDLLVLRVNPVDHDTTDVLLIERGHEPFQGQWALPGGFLEYDERPIDAAVRECLEETGIDANLRSNLRFVKMLDNPDRDPRGRVISYLYTAWVPTATRVRAGDDAAKAEWFPLSEANRMELAFDHNEALRTVGNRGLAGWKVIG